MQRINKHIVWWAMMLLLLSAGFSCSKDPFVITDPSTGQALTDLTSTNGSCYVVRISQKNKNSTSNDNAFVIERDGAYVTTRMTYYDSITSKTDYDIKVTQTSGKLSLSTGEYFTTDPSDLRVNTFTTKADLSDPNSDNQLYQYSYNADGYLVKKLLFINGSSTAAYETNYTYSSDNLLTHCSVYAGAKKIKLIESSLEYDMKQPIKPWLYLFPDFFEGYQYLQSFNFGKRPTFAVKSIVTVIYDTDTGGTLDTWTTNFTGYVISKDNFVLQTMASGDQQQGLGLIFGTTRFDYQCTK